MESLTPLPLGKETQGLDPSPITKMLERLRRGLVSGCIQRTERDLPSGKSSVQDISNVNNVETTVVPLPRNNHTRSTHVSSTGNHDDVSGLKLYVVDNLVVDQVELDGVVGLDERVRVSDGSSVVGDEVRDTLLAELVGLDLQELVRSLFRGDSVDGESTLDVVQQSEVFTGSLDGDDV